MAPEDVLSSLPAKSQAMQEVVSLIHRVAGSDISVLIVGESGTGKELVAKAIHQQSLRKDGPFVAVKCGAIPETLLESELFGHENGEFIGAQMQRPGRIESADRGTLFLDEIGEISPALQVKLLRVLEERTIERVGGRVEIHVDTRVLVATNMDLQLAMKDGRFREDLYYQLNTVTIPVPPLRERKGDITLLANALLQRFGDEAQKKVAGFSRGALLSLEQYHWPGNVRELENRIRRAVTLTDYLQIAPEDLDLEEPKDVQAGPTFPTLKEARVEAEIRVIEQALARTGGNITQAAMILAVSRPTLHDLISRHNIRKCDPVVSHPKNSFLGTSPEISTDFPSEMDGMEDRARINEIIEDLTGPFSPGQRAVEMEVTERIVHEVCRCLREKGIEPITRKDPRLQDNS